MSTEELRLYNHVPAKISLEMSDDPTTSTVREADNAIYFTREQFCIGLRFPASSLVKQFLHFTRALPALYPGTSCTCTPECFADSNGLQCAKLSILAEHLTGGDLFQLHFEAWDGGLHVCVGP